MPKDRKGNIIKKGDKVIWYDPQEEYRDLTRLWEVVNISGEVILIADEVSEAEVLESELEKC